MEPQLSGTSAILHSIFFPSVDTGYASGSSGTILKTTDGGADWTLQSSGTTNFLYSIFFPGTTTGYAVGLNGTILSTSNGGLKWDHQPSGTDNWLVSVCFAGLDTGYVVGQSGTILKTTNGGLPVGINERHQTCNLKICPNPATEKIVIELPKPASSINGTVSICRIDGNELIRQQIQDSGTEINVSSTSKRNLFRHAD